MLARIERDSFGRSAMAGHLSTGENLAENAVSQRYFVMLAKGTSATILFTLLASRILSNAGKPRHHFHYALLVDELGNVN